MEANSKEIYVSPAVGVVEVKAEAAILEASRPDYIPEAW